MDLDFVSIVVIATAIGVIFPAGRRLALVMRRRERSRALAMTLVMCAATAVVFCVAIAAGGMLFSELGEASPRIQVTYGSFGTTPNGVAGDLVLSNLSSDPIILKVDAFVVRFRNTDVDESWTMPVVRASTLTDEFVYILKPNDVACFRLDNHDPAFGAAFLKKVGDSPDISCHVTGTDAEGHLFVNAAIKGSLKLGGM